VVVTLRAKGNKICHRISGALSSYTLIARVLPSKTTSRYLFSGIAHLVYIQPSRQSHQAC